MLQSEGRQISNLLKTFLLAGLGFNKIEINVDDDVNRSLLHSEAFQNMLKDEEEKNLNGKM